MCVSQVSGEGVVGLLQDDASLNTESGAVANPVLSLQVFFFSLITQMLLSTMNMHVGTTSIRRKEHSPGTSNSKSLSSWG